MSDFCWYSDAQVDRAAASKIISESSLAQLAESMRVLTGCVAPFTQAGWLLEVCCNERIKEKFDAAHNLVVDTLKVGNANPFVVARSNAPLSPHRANRKVLCSPRQFDGPWVRHWCQQRGYRDVGGRV